MELADKYMGIYSGSDPNALQGTLELNELGAFIFRKLENEISEDELVKEILSEYEVDEKVAKSDLVDVLDVLRKNNIIE